MVTTRTARLSGNRPRRRSQWPMRLAIAGGGLLIAVIVVAGCGGGNESVASETASVAVEPTSTVSPTPLAPTPTPGTDPVAVSLVEDVLYREPTDSDGAGSTVDIYVGDGNEGAPLVVLLHGFSVNGPGRPDVDLGPLGEEIAGLGSTVFNFGWQTTFGFSADSVADLSCVGPFVAARAAEFGADPDNIIVVGHSMGAETGSMLAFSTFDLHASPDCIETGQASSPVAFVGIGGAYGMVGGPLDEDDTRFLVRSWPRGTLEELDGAEEVLTGLTAAQLYQLDGYSAIRPVGELDTVLVVGSNDQYAVSNADITARFAQALQGEGVDVEVVTVEGATHEDVVDPATEYGQATLQVIADILTNTR